MTQSDNVSGNGDKQLNRTSNVPKLPVMRGRVILGLTLGISGICLGVTGAIFKMSALTIAAAICAVLGCFVIAGAALFSLMPRRTGRNLPVGRADTTSFNHSGGTLQNTANTAENEQSVVDPVTELPDGRFFEVAVEGRVAAARRHLWPVSIVLLQLGFDDDDDDTSAERNSSLVTFASLMRQTLREADIACRIDDKTFGLILEDTSEEGGVWTAERLQIALSHDITTIRRLVAGVAAYPTHGLFYQDVLSRAQAALHRASSTPAGHGLGQVEVAHVDLS